MTQKRHQQCGRTCEIVPWCSTTTRCRSRRQRDVDYFARRRENAAAGFFEELGFKHIGPVDSHDLPAPLVYRCSNVARCSGIRTHFLSISSRKKAHDYRLRRKSADKGHAVNKFDVATGVQVKSQPKAPTFTRVFADALIREAEEDDKVVAITAAMPSGTGLDIFGKRFPGPRFDVGIAEQHAVTFAAGMAVEGMKPFCAIYSTFLQRAYDQVVHDVALQNLPVRFAMDRAGLVGSDGATHAGSFDLAYLCCLPGMTVMAAADEAELVHMVATATAYSPGPRIAFHLPRGEGAGVASTHCAADSPHRSRPGHRRR